MQGKWIAVLLITLFALTSCSYFQTRAPHYCWQDHLVSSPCGTCIKSKCEDICKLCTFNEPSCQACWACISDEGCAWNTCGYNGNQCNSGCDIKLP
jgi:hypothetical protein